MTILVVDDEMSVATLVQAALMGEGYDCEVSLDPEIGLEMVSEHKPRLIVLDWNMPNMSGIEFCQAVRDLYAGYSQIPSILMLTARAKNDDRLVAYAAGADAYEQKPFHLPVLVAHVRALLRRDKASAGSGSATMLTFPCLRINVETHEVFSRGPESLRFQRVSLTTKEFQFLALLAQRPGQIWERDDILSRLWSAEKCSTPRSIDTIVSRLRLKLGAGAGRYVKTVVGAGYQFNLKEGAES